MHLTIYKKRTCYKTGFYFCYFFATFAKYTKH
ncbi:hypothetical protein [Lactococcus phage D7138]